MIFAAAQTKPTRFNIEVNLHDHYKFIELASKNNADLIIFPELSITGYERDKAREMAFTVNDERLNKLRKLSVSNNIIIVAGAPILIEEDLFIGSFVIKPDDSVSIYTKHFLHEGEEVYYEPSFTYDPILEFQGEKISLAICADIDHVEHPQEAKKKGATFYMPGIFFSPGGIPNAYKALSDYAQRFSMNILMSNFVGQSWGSDAGGMSGFWNKEGKCVAQLNDTDEGLLLIEKVGKEYIRKSIYNRSLDFR